MRNILLLQQWHNDEENGCKERLGYTVLEEGLQALSIQLSKKITVNIYRETNICWYMDVCMISTKVALCASHAFQHNFHLFIQKKYTLCQKCLVSLKSPDWCSLLIA